MAGAAPCCWSVRAKASSTGEPSGRASAGGARVGSMLWSAAKPEPAGRRFSRPLRGHLTQHAPGYGFPDNAIADEKRPPTLADLPSCNGHGERGRPGLPRGERAQPPGDGQQFDQVADRLPRSSAALPARLRRRKSTLPRRAPAEVITRSGNAAETGKLSLKHGLEPGL